MHTYVFDADSKLKTVDSNTAYTYDGEGKRVRKLVGENTRFIYGISGDLIAEFSGVNGNLFKEYVSGGGMMAVIDPSLGTRYTTSDHLGSPRVVTNSSGAVISRHDYMAFGVELGSGISGRSSGAGYAASDGVRNKFTGYERDTETGLDYAQARYYSSLQGRFTSVDPFGASASTSNPQTLNRYTYVLNSPYTMTDPSGMVQMGLRSANGQDVRNGGGIADTGGAFTAGGIEEIGIETQTISDRKIAAAFAEGDARSEARLSARFVAAWRATYALQQSPNTYPSPLAAGVAALMIYNQTSIQQNLEYAGEVCEQQAGVFFYTLGPAAARTPNSSDTGSCPAGTREAADWHTHAAHDPALVTRGFLGLFRKDHNERFSDGDKISNNQKNVPGYLATPKNRIKVFVPGAPGQNSTKGKVKTLRLRTP